MRRTLSLLTAALALAGPGAAGAHASPLRGLQLPAISGTTSTEFLTGQVKVAHSLNAKLVRTEVFWDKLEPKAKGQRDATYLAQIDATLNQAKADGLKVLVTLDDTPCWASTNSDCAKAAGYPPKDPGDYADIAAFLAGRYRSQLAAIEIWNEPDHQSEYYFGGPDKPARYAAIVRAAYPAIKKASPSTKVLAGSLVGANGKFLSALYQHGIKGYYDGLSVHYYDLVLASLRAIRAVQLAHGDHKPVWLGEFGWTSCFPDKRTEGGHTCVTPQQQAENLEDIYASLRRTSWVAGAIVYNLQDSEQYQFGLITTGRVQKPAFTTMASVFAHAPAHVRPVTLALKRSGSSVVASGGAPAGDVLEVDAYRSGRLRFKGTFRLDRDNRFALRLPAVLGTHGLKVRILQYWTGKKAVRTI